MKKILFVCEGNTCRSPMAKALCDKHLKESGLDGLYSCDSAGTGAYPGEPAHEKAIAVMREIGIDITGHRTKKLTPSLLSEADMVFTMTPALQFLIAEAFPEKAEKVSVIGKSIDDPYGKAIGAYRDCRDTLDGHIQNIAALIRQELSGKGYPVNGF
ncbi:MAG: low molecular weight phosphatase family protein [Oscillospiraceae bacterium]|jgi:protein-tyrosine-phosphatase|nr:low molecular weight phosphatase family protein [Oscillospiraceae bacterium]